MRGSTIAAVGLALLTLAAGTAEGQGRRGPRARPAEIEEQLASADRDVVQTAIETIGLSGNPRFVPLLAARIMKGLPPELLETAVDTLTVLGRPEAGDVLFVLASHRRAEIRARAVAGIISCRPEGASSALQSALSDLDPHVRSAAAVGLGQIEAAGATDALFHALDRNILEAATSLGQLVAAGEVARVLGYLGQVPLDVVTPALSEIIARENMEQETKLEVLGRIAELATPDARQFLVDMAESVPNDRRHRALREAATAAAERIVQ
ncbi:MAG: hypothetical protein DRJ42_28875 [Deltaproteobacteria bacterium]|nr:MAG: hypothetical protein DRJ42_28875 [Deltaproteobacteria bacterium]